MPSQHCQIETGGASEPMKQLNLSHWYLLHREPERYAEYRRRVIHQMAQGIDRDQAERVVFRQMEREREKMN